MFEKYWQAIQSRDMDALRDVLNSQPALAEERNEQGAHGIQVATYYGNQEAARRIAERVSTLDLPCACCLGDAASVGHLLRQRIDPDALSADGFRPLGLAAAFGGAEVVEALLDGGADIEAVSVALPVRPLHAAVFGRKHKVVALLLERGADVNAAQEGGFTALHGAAQNGMAETVALLLDKGADPNAKASDGKVYTDYLST